jgi:hypothetical protein
MAISTIGASALDSGVSQLGKNLIINGAMTVAQRGTSFAAQGTNNATYTLDRWANFWHQGTEQGEFTVSQDTDVPTGYKGFSMKLDCTTAEASVSADEAEYGATQPIEAQNLQQLAYGAASAKSITLSFWVKSPKSGTHCVSFYQEDGNRTYIAEYTVASADTWEKISVVVPGDTSGTINNDNGQGLRVSFPMFAGANRVTTAGSWTAGSYYASSNQQNLLDNTANNFYLFNVQLEVGSVATDFEHEDIGTTLGEVQRYFRRWTVQDASGQIFGAITMNVATAAMMGPVSHPVRMRGAPTASISSLGHFVVADGANANKTASAATFYAGVDAFHVYFTIASGTLGGGYIFRDVTDALYFDFTAEL